jgi:hypothetical protein
LFLVLQKEGQREEQENTDENQPDHRFRAFLRLAGFA